jgi:hypothetical protein
MILATVALTSALLTGGHAATTAAVTSPTVHAVAIQNGVPDTTNMSGPGTTDSPNGPVWAHDNIVRDVTATPDAAGNNEWDVTVVSTGQYIAQGNPITGAAWHGTGAMAGYVQYVVSVPAGTIPSASSLPRVLPSSEHSMDIVDQLFGQPAGSPDAQQVQTGNNGAYDFVYTGIPGAPGGLYFQHS